MVNKQKILIVDDDINIAELISLYLTKECFDTMIVGDGESALACVDSFAPNLILGISDEISSTGDIERIRLVGKIVDEYNAKLEG